MTEQDFNQLLHRFERGLCSREEQRKLEEWLDNMNEEGALFKSAAEKQSMKASLHDSVFEKAGIARRKGRSVILSAWMKVAAAVLMLVLASYALTKVGFVENDPINIAVESQRQEGIRKILLSDGSIIWLKGDSKLSYPERFEGSERVVFLAGEALFEVSKDPSRPFLIHTGDLTTRVLGTSFNIKSTSDHTEVYVLTGKVSVSLTETNEKIELLPNEKVRYSHASKRLHREDEVIENKSLSEYIKGTEYNMHFHDTKVSEIANRIEQKFSVDVSIKGDIQSCVITADLTDQSLNHTLDMISEALNATYEIDGDQVVLRGNGCE